MDNIEEAQKIVTDSFEMVSKIKKARSEILEKQESFKGKLESLNNDLGQALVRAMFGTEVPAEVNLLRKQIRDSKAFLADADLILTSLDAFEQEQKQMRLEPQAQIRSDAEEKRMIKLNMDLQKKLLEIAASSEQYMHRDEFKKVAERFRRNALSLNQEAQADSFLKSLRI